MTVKELKALLENIPDDTKIVITSVDPTDYTYINDIEDVTEGYLIDVEGGYIVDLTTELEDDDLFENITKVLVLDGGNV